MSASENGELQLMAEYDFKAPIKSTVIIFESDEDLEPSDKNEENNNDEAINLNAIISDIFKDIRKASNKPKNKAKTSNTKRKLKNEVKNRKKENNANKKNTEFVFQNEPELLKWNYTETLSNNQTNSRKEESLIYNTNSLQSSYNDQILANTFQDTNFNINENFTNDVQSGSNKQNGTSFQQSSINSQFLTNPSQRFGNEMITKTVQGCNRVPFVSTSEKAFSQSLNDFNTKTKDCTHTLLDTVSTHMILILKGYAEYAAIARKSPDTKLLEAAEKHYLDTKSHLFYLSFSVIANIVLPKENDAGFIETFIDNTVKYAKIKKCYFGHCEVRTLWTEMFSWVKSHIQHDSLNKTSRPTMTPSNHNFDSCREQQNCEKSRNIDNLCIFKSGPPGRELVLSLKSTVAQNTVPERNIMSSSEQPTYHLRRYANPGTCIENFQTFYTSSHGDDPSQISTRLLRANQHQTNEQEQINHSQQIAQAATSRPPWQHESVITQNYSSNELINSAHYGFQTDQGHDSEVNRSLSRDSGFMSPLSSVQNDPMCHSPGSGQAYPSLTVTPMITHVTSLNPSVAYMKDGICHVCKKLTKLKCLGCYKCYYCSHQCQTDDWRNHAQFCKL